MPGLNRNRDAVVGFHFQYEDVFGWQQALQLQKEGTINKFFQVQMCSAAKAVRPDSQTVMRHHMDGQTQNAYLDAPNKTEAANSIFRRFVDGTFLEHAHNIDAIEFTNETWGPDQSRRFKAEALDIAGLRVWNREWRRKDPRLSHIRLIVCNAAVGNNNSLAVARVIQEEDGICGYHPYIPVLNGQILRGEEAGNSLRWMALDDLWRRSGVTVDWFFGEIGAVGYRANSQGVLVAYESGWGWQHPSVLNRDFKKYLEILDVWAARVMAWNTTHGNRAYGGTIFSSGPSWEWFQVRQPQLNEAAIHYRNFQPVAPVPVPDPAPQPQPELKPKGTDVSHWQGAIDWQKMKAAGIQFVFIKSSEGTSWIDDRFSRNWQGSKAAGIPRGAYHFFKSGLDPVLQAKHFANVLPPDAELPPVVDVEDNSYVPNNLAFRLVVFLEHLEQLTGQRPIIYTGAWFWNPYLGEQPWAKDYDLWIAAYTSAASPGLPSGWSDWKFWQYTSSGYGPSYGASSKGLDLNWFNGTLEELRQYADGGQSQPPTPAPAPNPPPVEEPTEADRNRFWKIGWHAGVGGNRSGIGEYMRKLDEAGIPFSVKSVGDAGLAVEAAQYARKSGIKHNVILRYPLPADRPHDKPDFNLAPAAAAVQHWALIKGVIPKEIEPFKDIIWIEPTNEIDTHTKAAWLGGFMYEIAKLMNADGYKALLSGFNAGQPEKEHWFLSGMRQYLELAAARPDQVAISLHEGKTSGGKYDPIEGFYPHMIGRYEWLFAACDEMGIARPNVFLSEWAWNYNDMPEVSAAMEDLDWLAEKLAQYPQIRGAFLWCLQGGSEWGNLPNMLVRLMKPVTDKTLSVRFKVEPEEPPEEPIETFTECLRALAMEKQVIHFNQDAALQKAMTADGYVQMSEEFKLLNDQGVECVAQSAYNLAGKPERVYFCPIGQWSQVNWLPLSV